ncbi:hypothetical protein [Emticicia sp. 17c]|uniref:hypothetical protein n=1 Tax=Emticicia sp. 17c TaxID=3127704 RepID=UPI00301BE285
MDIITGIFAAIGSIADPISKIFVSKDNVRIAKITTEQLQQQLKIAEQEEDTQKIALASKALELKQTTAKQETNQKVLQGVVVMAGLGLLGLISWLLFSKNDKKNSTPKVS